MSVTEPRQGMDKTFQPDRCESYRTVQLDNPTPRNISCSLEILFRVTNFGMGLHLVLGPHGIARPEFLARQLFSGILSRVLQPRAQDTIIILKSRTGSIDDSLLGIYYAALLPQPRSCSKTRRFRTRACTYRSQDLRGYYRHKVRSDVIFIRCESFYIALQRHHSLPSAQYFLLRRQLLLFIFYTPRDTRIHTILKRFTAYFKSRCILYERGKYCSYRRRGAFELQKYNKTIR